VINSDPAGFGIRQQYQMCLTMNIGILSIVKCICRRGTFNHLFQLDPSCPLRQFPHSLHKAVERLRRNASFRLCPTGKDETQKLPRPWSRHCAFLYIDLEFELAGDEAANTLHHSLPRPPALHIDVTGTTRTCDLLVRTQKVIDCGLNSAGGL